MEYSFGKIDLHIHSTASDGSLSPGQIIEYALKKGISAVSITDHDTVDGIDAVFARQLPESIEFVSGVEISAAFPASFENSGSIHILGYGIATDNPDLNAILKKQQSARAGRNPVIIDRLNDMGIPASLDSIVALSGKKEVARPHIADFLVKSGHAKDIDDAFDTFLGRGKPAYAEKYKVSAEKAISGIRSAGGIAVLAHPALIVKNVSGKHTSNYLESLIETLVSYGLEGIEAYYPDHTGKQTDFLKHAAGKRNLLITGGTDFHGDMTPGIEMGTGKGDFFVPYEIFDRLKKTLRHPNGK